ncbi:MAG: response regulator [Bacteroidia bacterium]
MIKLFLVEDHHVVRYGIKSLIDTNPAYVVIGESNNAADFLSQITNVKVDLVITDISMEGMNGIELTRKIRKLTKGEIKVLILSMHADDLYINQCFEAGADGYLLKDFTKTELFGAIDKIMKGGIYTSRSVSQILANNYLNREFSGKSKSPHTYEITKRERQIIELISLGLNNKEIASKLLLSTSTIDVHRYNILKKLEVKNTAEMIMKALKLKLINVNEI